MGSSFAGNFIPLVTWSSTVRPVATRMLDGMSHVSCAAASGALASRAAALRITAMRFVDMR